MSDTTPSLPFSKTDLAELTYRTNPNANMQNANDNTNLCIQKTIEDQTQRLSDPTQPADLLSGTLLEFTQILISCQPPYSILRRIIFSLL